MIRGRRKRRKEIAMSILKMIPKIADIELLSDVVLTNGEILH